MGGRVLVTLTLTLTLTLTFTLILIRTLTLTLTRTRTLTLTSTLTLALHSASHQPPRYISCRWAAAWQRVLPATRAVRNHPVLLVDSAGGGSSASSHPFSRQRQSRPPVPQARRPTNSLGPGADDLLGPLGSRSSAWVPHRSTATRQLG